MFTGRKYEIQKLKQCLEKNATNLVVAYGRRRVGKTRLVQEFCRSQKRAMWQFDGLEDQPQKNQIKNFLAQLAEHTGNKLYLDVVCHQWLDCFKHLNEAINQQNTKQPPVIFFDEFPYLASDRSQIVSDLKWAWDNLWARKNNFHLILCGSVASFMVEKVLKSSALYGRITLEICLKPFLMQDLFEFFKGKKSYDELIELFLFCGGIPAYLEQIDSALSVSQNIDQLAFQKDGYFVGEFDRIFKDTFKKDSIYKKIVRVLGKYKNLKTPEILDTLSVQNGGTFQKYLKNLELAGFIEGQTPWDKDDDESRLKRYAIWDEYLLFYHKFILPNQKRISNNTRENLFYKIQQSQSYKAWAGLAFERLCIKHAPQIMKTLQIDQLVKRFGPYFDKANNTKEGIQVDLMFERHDPVLTICEMKYQNRPVGKEIIAEMEKKISILKDDSRTIEKVLITNADITADLKKSGYFERVITARDVFIENL